MLKINPHAMNDGEITSISIINENLKEVVEISPIPFDLFIQEDVKKVISRYYLKKKTCENLIQQLEMAQSEFEESKTEFESLTHIEMSEPPLPEIKEEPQPKHTPRIKPYITPKEPERKILPPEEPEPSPPVDEPEPIIEFKPEPLIISETIESAPAPAPPSLGEITTKIIESDEFKILIANNQLSDTTIRTAILKVSPSEWEETIHEMVITQLKEKGIIEPSFFEKITKKVRGRPKK